MHKNVSKMFSKNKQISDKIFVKSITDILHEIAFEIVMTLQATGIKTVTDSNKNMIYAR